MPTKAEMRLASEMSWSDFLTCKTMLACNHESFDEKKCIRCGHAWNPETDAHETTKVLPGRVNQHCCGVSGCFCTFHRIDKVIAVIAVAAILLITGFILTNIYFSVMGFFHIEGERATSDIGALFIFGLNWCVLACLSTMVWFTALYFKTKPLDKMVDRAKKPDIDKKPSKVREIALEPQPGRVSLMRGLIQQNNIKR